MIKWAIRIIILLVALLAFAIAAIVLVIDPNDFKGEIQKTIKDKANLNVRFEDKLSWSFFPSLGLNINKFTLYADQQFKQSVVGVDSAHVGINIKSLVQSLNKEKKNIDFDDISIDGLNLNLIEDKDGKLNIVKLFEQQKNSSSNDSQEKADPQTEHTADSFIINIPNIRLSNADINYRDKNNNAYAIHLSLLELDKPRLNESFNFLIDGVIKDNKELNVALRSDAKLKIDLDKEEYLLSDLNTLITLKNILDGQLKTTIKTPKIIFNQQKQQLNTARIVLNSNLEHQAKKLQAELNTQGLHFNLESQKLLAKELQYDVSTQGISPQYIQAQGAISTIAVNLKTVVADLQNIAVNARVSGIAKEVIPAEFHAEKLRYAVNTSNLSLNQALLKTLGIQAQISIDQAQLGAQQKINGRVATNSFDLKNTLVKFGQTIDVPEQALRSAKITSNFSYSNNAFSLTNLQALIDDSKLSGKLSVSNFDNPNINTQLSVNRINLNNYLNSGSAKKTSGDSTRAKKSSGNSIADASRDNTAILPIEELKKLRLKAQLKIGDIQYEQYKINNLNCAINANGSQLQLSSCALNTLGGSLKPTLSLTLNQQPNITGSLSANHFSIEKLSTFVSDKKLATGQLNLSANFKSTGNSSAAIIKNNNASATIKLDDVVVKNINLSNILNEKLGSELNNVLLSSLQKNNIKLPLSDSKDTHLKAIKLAIQMRGSNISLDEINGTLNNGDKLRGDASYNIVSNDFDAHLKMLIAKQSKHPYLGGVEWPLRCNGNLDSNPLSWCGVDANAMKATLTKVAENASKRKARELIEKKLGVTLDPNKSIQQAAQDELSKRAQEKIDKQKKKLNDKINEKVNDKLNKALGDLFK